MCGALGQRRNKGLCVRLSINIDAQFCCYRKPNWKQFLMFWLFDYGLMKLALLAKWQWRYALGDNSLWHSLIDAKYEVNNVRWCFRERG
ncbi:hypothetical protein V6N13_092618 [Hibiscus sabdariffa]|uniref:Uncharacterized protein n=2 Tax=Hibiscus sabdariffa TaxID=183260 RepID=A0ABR2CCU8_9ROSI